MQKTGKIFFSVSFVLFVIFMWMMIQTFKPIRNVQPDEVIEIKGKVTKIEEGSGFDIAITLENDSHYYYINRGLQYGLTIEELQKELLNKNVTLYPIHRWTIFTRDKIMGHISKLMIEDRVIFNELNNDIHEQTIQ
ncbi:hypothetical protein D1818_16180 [Aquimarina sp. BL5]|uniref:hypothetical protein n=1 Tax=Aquimarina sp. BL5 TaxID=1714860 RepID=UPI000E52B332|nr:hypothetical protein [Aquimarina sp. BL5]AXT52303.1 hypothetical protein D1818_16180 [Aquimarina sp. BL5]RKN09974.1 hypothetical protein D7036_03385 [Aquimarina sp. BL5]